MDTVNLEFSCDGASINPHTGRSITVNVSDAEVKQVLSHFDEVDIVGHFDTKKLLDQMDVETVKDHLGLTDITEE